MKKLLFALIVITVSTASCKQTEATEQITTNDNTKIVEDTSHLKMKKNDDGYILISGKDVPPDENIITSKENSKTDKVINSSTLFKENIKGAVHKIIQNKYMVNQNLPTTQISIYNYDGNIVYFEEKYNDISNTGIKESYTYDKSKKLIKTTRWVGGYKDQEKVYIYNKGKLIYNITKTFVIDNVTSSKEKYIYDTFGNVIEENLENSDGSISRQFAYKYNNKNQQIEVKLSYDTNGFNWKNTFDEYNKNGDVIKSTYYENQFEKGILKRKFIYEYEYDSKNNWIKQIYKEKGKITITVKREIEYY
jgi:hypothetical protein